MKQTVIKAGASVAVFHEHRVLLVLRGKEPMKGYWSLPGGGLEPGETPIEAAYREITEETTLSVRRLLPVLQFAPHRIVDGVVTQSNITIHVFATRHFNGSAVARDDARDVQWADLDRLGQLKLTPRAEEIILEARRVVLTET